MIGSYGVKTHPSINSLTKERYISNQEKCSAAIDTAQGNNDTEEGFFSYTGRTFHIKLYVQHLKVQNSSSQSVVGLQQSTQALNTYNLSRILNGVFGFNDSALVKARSDHPALVKARSDHPSVCSKA